MPEWLDDEGNPTVLFVKPLTMADRRRLDMKHKDDSAERMVTICIRNVFDAEGNAVFEESDRRQLLTGVSSTPLQRLAFAASGLSLEDLIGQAEKN